MLAAPSSDSIIARTHDPRKTAKVTPVPGGFIIHDRVTLRATQTISVWSLRQPQPLHEWTITLPDKATEVAVSPDGRRVAWLLTGGSGSSQALWVSALDGGGMREIGAVPIRKGAVGGRPPSFVSQLDWVPGDKAVSFLYGDALWTVPAP